MIFLILIILAVIIIQDLKERAISWWTIPLLLITIVFFKKATLYWETILWSGVLNIIFLGLQLIIISIYFSIKEKKALNIMDRYLGWGDVLFLIPVAFLFSFQSFILFYVSSLLFVLLAFLVYKGLIQSNVRTIPLAGGQALLLSCLLISSKVFDFNIDTIFPSF